MKRFTTLAEALLDAADTAHRLTLIGEGKAVTSLSYAELLESAGRYAAIFAANGLRRGKRAVIAAHDLEVFFGAFWGAVLCGAAAIPFIPPMNGYTDSNSPELQRLRHIAEIAEPVFVAADEAAAPLIQSAVDGLTAVLPLSQKTAESCPPLAELPETAADDTAVILFTSGSTAMPKGVPITHAQAIAGAYSSAEKFGVNTESSFLNWLPPEHITTLFMHHILPVVLHADQVHILPSEILSDPKQILVLLDRYHVNMTFAPNFFYRLLMAQKEEIKQLPVSLSSMTTFVNGGEMIHYPTVSACVELLSKKGFRPEAMIPGWGMTETVYGVVFSKGLSGDTYQECVSVGTPVSGLQYRLMKDNTELHGEDTEGSLQIKGDWIFRGYLNETEAEHAGRFTEDGWFRTGDLAVIHRGGLVITGRESDIFIVNGVNYSIGSMEYELRQALPERYSESLIRMRAVRDADTGADRLFVFAEQKTDDEPEELVSTFRHTAEKCFGFPVTCVYAVPSGSIPRTGIGKIDGKALVENAQAGKYSAAAEKKQVSAAELTDEENLILFIWAEALGLNKQELTPEDDFFLIGGDSARVPQVLQRINTALSADINAAQFVRYPTVHALLDFLHNGEEAAGTGTDEDTEEIILL